MTSCKSCGGLVNWVQIQGRWHCHNANGSDHWDTCSKRRWQQTKETGERFENKKLHGQIVSGYKDSIHGTKFDRMATKSVKGADYKLSGKCGQCVPPWETCLGCPDAFAA